MPSRNSLREDLAPPVDEASNKLASKLKTSRLRGSPSVQAVADRIDVSRRLVSDAEGAKPSTGVAVYLAMLWSLGLLEDLARVASPKADGVGFVSEQAQEGARRRAGPSEEADFWPPKR